MFLKGVVFLRNAVKSARNNGFFYQQDIAISRTGCPISPAEEEIRSVIRKAGMIIRKNTRRPLSEMIKELNNLLKGWTYYHRHVVASEAFTRVDNYVSEQLWKMLHGRHPKKNGKWLAGKYWCVIFNSKRFIVKAKLRGKLTQILICLITEDIYG